MSAALVATLLALAATPTVTVTRFAITIGNNHAEEGGGPDLRYADDDAAAMHELLLEAGVHSVLLAAFDADTARLHPRTIPEARPTVAALERVFGDQIQQMKVARTRGPVDWIFYFSGHGEVSHGEGHASLEDGPLTRTMLAEELLGQSPATTNHVIIDACKSYFLAYEKGPGGERRAFGRPFATRSGRVPRTGYLLSTSSERASHEWERLQAGIFSYEIRSALRGGADADGDGRLSYDEIGAFLGAANGAISSPVHRPDFVVVPPSGEASGLTDAVLGWSTRSVRVDQSVGHVYVERSTGERLADVHLAAGLSVELHLPNDRPLFVRTADDSEERTLTVPYAALSSLKPDKSMVASKGAQSLAFESLFAEPFGAAQVGAFRVSYLPPELEVEDRLDLRTPLLVTFAGAALLGVGSTLWALERQGGGAALSQELRESRNAEIETLNFTAVIFYSVAAISGATFAIWSMTNE